MKLTNKEMAILSVFLSIVIIVAGVFLFIMPEYEKIDPNRNSLESAKNQKDQIYQSLAREATIDQEIQDAIDQANVNALYFYDDLTTYEADVILREILEANNMSTKTLTVNSYTTSTLSVTDYIETIVTYPLKEYSGFVDDRINAGELTAEYDEDGNLIIPDDFMEKFEDALKEYMTALLSTQTQTVGSITVTFTAEGRRGDFLNFLNYVADLERATHIDSTTISYTAVVTANNNNNAAAGNPEDVALPVANATSAEQTLTENSEISANVTMTFYCITPMTMPEEQTTTAAEAEPAA